MFLPSFRTSEFVLSPDKVMNWKSELTMLLGFGAILIFVSGAGAQPAPGATQPASALQKLSSDFWEWRAAEQPFSFDDIPRLDRPAGWAPDWSPATVVKRRDELSAFENRWKAL